MTDINIGLIGAGRIGKVHGRSISTQIEGASIGAVADVYLPGAEELAAKHNIPHVSDDYRSILDDPDIDAVAICSATDTHAQIIQEAADAGKHIFCEKPIDHDLAKIDAALAAVEKAGIKLQIGFNRRFDPNFSKVQRMIAEGAIGTPHILRITSRDPAPPPIDYVKVSGGIFVDMTIHDFDMARFLINSDVMEVYTAAAVLVDQAIGEVGDVDTTIITLKFANGTIGTIDNSRQAVYGYDQRVEVFGSKGMLAAENNRPDNVIYSHADRVQTTLPLYFFLERYMPSFIEEMKAFISSIQNDTPPLVRGIDGRIPVVMGLAAKKSYEENRPVRLSEVGG